MTKLNNFDKIQINGKEFEVIMKMTATDDLVAEFGYDNVEMDQEYNDATQHLDGADKYDEIGTMFKGDMAIILRPIDPFRGLEVVQQSVVGTAEKIDPQLMENGDVLIHARKKAE